MGSRPFASATKRSLFALLLVCGACDDEKPIELPSCPEHDPSASPSVAGTFRYDSLAFGLSGEIVFEQDGELVRVVDTTYDQPDVAAIARSLEGEAMLDGNLLEVSLVPTNGDTDYGAEVTLVFGPSGNDFCLLEFTDTNDDRGGEGSYTGTR
jgi:hypothetical protein